MRARRGEIELGVGDVARLRGISRWTAKRWMRALEAKYGVRVVARRGRRMFTTARALEAVAPAVAPAAKAERRIVDLELRMADAEVRADKTASDVVELRRAFQAKAAAWYSKKPQ